MKLPLLLIISLFTPAYAEKISTNTEYLYQYDSKGYANHQINEKTSYKDYEVSFQHNETVSQTEFWYEHFLISKNTSLLGIQTKFGIGSIYGQDWNAIPAYQIELQKSNLNLSITRNAIAASQFNQTNGLIYSKNYSDDIVLSYDIVVNNKFTVVVGGLLSEINDGNQKKGVLLKNIYQIDDNISLQTHSRLVYYTNNSTSYFSPDIFETHRFLLVYARPLFGNNTQFKFSAGPSLVNINDRRELVPYYDVKLIHNTNNAGKFTVGYMCQETTLDYKYCQLGGNVQLNF